MNSNRAQIARSLSWLIHWLEEWGITAWKEALGPTHPHSRGAGGFLPEGKGVRGFS